MFCAPDSSLRLRGLIVTYVMLRNDSDRSIWLDRYDTEVVPYVFCDRLFAPLTLTQSDSKGCKLLTTPCHAEPK